MLFLKGYKKEAWWIAAETEDDWFDLHTTHKPYIDSEPGKELYLEAICEAWEKNPKRPPLKALHCWPLAYAELR